MTEARRLIREHRQRTGESVSFTAFVIARRGRAVADNPHMHAVRDRRGRLVLFHDANVNTMFAAPVDGRQTGLPHIVQAADKKRVRQNHDEIRSVQQQIAARGSSAEARHIKRFVALPAWVRRLFYRHLYGTPRLLHERFGPVSLTAVGMIGRGGGRGLPFGNHTLSVTLTMNHDLIDGAPATRFAQQVKDLVESAHGLGSV